MTRWTDEGAPQRVERTHWSDPIPPVPGALRETERGLNLAALVFAFLCAAAFSLAMLFLVIPGAARLIQWAGAL